MVTAYHSATHMMPWVADVITTWSVNCTAPPLVVSAGALQDNQIAPPTPPGQKTSSDRWGEKEAILMDVAPMLNVVFFSSW